MARAGSEALGQQSPVSVEVDPRCPWEPATIRRFEGGACPDGILILLDESSVEVLEALEPRKPILFAKRDALGHLVAVGRGVELIRVVERPTKLLSEKAS